MMPSYFYISKCSQAAVFSLSGSELYSTQLGARTFQMRTSQQPNGVDSVAVPVTGSLDQSQSRSQENSRLKRRHASLASPRPRGPLVLALVAASERAFGDTSEEAVAIKGKELGVTRECPC